MSQPTPYTPTVSFADEEADQVAGRSTVRTGAVDTEFDNLATTIGQTLANLSILQRDDTRLRDGLVELHTLSTEVLALIGSDGFVVRGAWLTATAYETGDIVTNATGTYVGAEDHTSGTFATDLAAGKWVLLFDSSVFAASTVTFSPTGTIAATNVQAAIAEAALEANQKAANLSDVANAATARNNLSAAEKVITTKGDIFVGGAAGAQARKAVGDDGEALLPSSGAADGLAWVAGAYSLRNASFTVTAAAKALTIALKTAGGSDPSDDDPVYVSFRNSSLTGGTIVTRKVAAALSMTITSGSTLGFSAAEVGRIRVGLIDNVGAVELCAYNPRLTLDVRRVSEHALQTTTAEGGAGGADSANAIYSTAARTNVPYRHLGYVDIQTGAVAGEWDNAATLIQMHGPGVVLPGEVVQERINQVGSVATGTTQLPFDDTIPDVAEGDPYFSMNIAPTAAGNVIEVEAELLLSSGTAGRYVSVALFKDSASAALAVSSEWHATADVMVRHSIRFRMVAGTTSSITFTARAGPGAAATLTFNGVATARRFGGVANSRLKLTEIQV